MVRLIDEEIAQFRMEQKARTAKKGKGPASVADKKNQGPAKTAPAADLGADSSATEINPTQVKKRKLQSTGGSSRPSVQSTMEQFVQKGTDAQGSSNPTSWKQVFREFENLSDEQASSLWDSRIDFTPFVDTSLLFPSDRDKVKTISLREVCQAVMTKSLEIAALTRLTEIELQESDESALVKQLEDKLKEIKKLKSTLSLSEKAKKAGEERIQNLIAEVEALQKERTDKDAALEAQAKLTAQVEEQLKAKEGHLAEVSAEKDNLKATVESLEESMSNLKMSVLEQLEVGFDKAKEQILFLNPSQTLNLEGIGLYMKIVGDQLVDTLPADEDCEEEEEEERGRQEVEEREEERESEGEEGHGENN